MDFNISIPGAIVGAFGTAALTLAGNYLIQQTGGRQRRLETDVAMKTENLALQKIVTMLQETHSEVVAKLQVENDELKKQVLESQSRYERKYSREVILAKYSFSHWGTSVIHRSHFCTHCLSVEPQLEIQLVERDRMMTCSHCKTVYHSPYQE